MGHKAARLSDTWQSCGESPAARGDREPGLPLDLLLASRASKRRGRQRSERRASRRAETGGPRCSLERLSFIPAFRRDRLRLKTGSTERAIWKSPLRVTFHPGRRFHQRYLPRWTLRSHGCQEQCPCHQESRCNPRHHRFCDLYPSSQDRLSLNYTLRRLHKDATLFWGSASLLLLLFTPICSTSHRHHNTQASTKASTSTIAMDKFTK